MILVLVVIAVLSAVAASRLGTNNNAVIAEAALIKSHLRFAQSLAMSTTSQWGIAFSPSSYTLQRDGAASSLQLPNVDSSTRTLSSGMTENDLAVNFDTWGSPGDTTLQLVLNGVETISITKNTGYVP